MAFIGLGFVSTVTILFTPEESTTIAGDLDAYRVWLFGGPVLTGAYISGGSAAGK